MPKRRNNDRDPKAFSRAYLASFGESVRTLRERQGVTLKQLAQLSGLSDRYIIQVEKGEANPSLESVLRLALALQTSVTGLLPEDSKNATASGPARKIFSSLKAARASRSRGSSMPSRLSWSPPKDGISPSSACEGRARPLSASFWPGA